MGHDGWLSKMKLIQTNYTIDNIDIREEYEQK